MSSAIQVCVLCREPWRLGHRCKPTLTSADRYYEAASKILEDEGPLAGNCYDNAHELGALIQQWIERKRDNWEPR